MAGIGELLQQAREAKGITLRQAEEGTKIRLRYLRALEKNDFAVLPGRVYTVGFIRLYSRYLGIDPEPLVSQFKQDYRPEVEHSHGSNYRRGAQTRSGLRWQWWGLVVLFAFLLVIGLAKGYPLNSANTKEPPLPPTEVDTRPLITVNNPGGNGEPVAITKPDEQDNKTRPGLREPGAQLALDSPWLLIEIVERDCWLSIVVDGKQDYQATAKPGTRLEYPSGDQIKITFGDAGAARVILNGEVQGFMGKYGAVVTREFQRSAVIQ